MIPSASGLPFDDIRALVAAMPGPDSEAAAAVRSRDKTLTKPLGSLGRLEAIAEWLAAWQGRAPPAVNRPLVAVFAGNHGVAARGVSAYPAAVTMQMVEAMRCHQPDLPGQRSRPEGLRPGPRSADRRRHAGGGAR
jgi:nicotinate-nucleotide--dimethylbenzimidazole phosphoribosyltransferase